MKQYSGSTIGSGMLVVVILFSGFIFLVSLSAYHVAYSLSVGNMCVIPVPWMIILLSSLGVLIGSLAYYLLSRSFLRTREMQNENVRSTLRFLAADERFVVKALISGEATQSELQKLTGMDKVKVHRVVARLAERDIVVKRRKGRMTLVSLHEDIQRVF